MVVGWWREWECACRRKLEGGKLWLIVENVYENEITRILRCKDYGRWMSESRSILVIEKKKTQDRNGC